MVTVLRVLLLLMAPIALAEQASSPVGFLPLPPKSSDSGELRFGEQLPKFEAKDTSGRTWRLEDLRGKFTLIYIWSTVEARLQDPFDRYPGVVNFLELPELQRFFDKVRNSENLQVLTFCRDYESGDYMRAQDYMKEKHYTFPVITDYVSISKLFDGNRPWVLQDQSLWSHQWIVNPEGRLAYPVRAWSFGRLLFEVERAAARN
jgi:peroxiredoxin